MMPSLPRHVQNLPGRAGWFLGTLLLAITVCAPALLVAKQSSPNLEHFPVNVAKAGRPVEINVRLNVSGKSAVYIRVYYKSLSSQKFRFVTMEPNLNEYKGVIPAEVVQPPAVQYFVLVLYSDQSVESLPSLNPYGQPFEIMVEAEKGRSSAAAAQKPPLTKGPASGPRPTGRKAAIEALVLSPEPFEEVGENDVVIAAGFSPGEVGVDAASIRLSVDGRDYTSAAEVSEYVITLSPKRVSRGTHKVTVSARDTQGNSIPPLVWRFIVGSPAQQEMASRRKNYQGRVYAELRQENFSGQKLNSNNLGANLTGKAGPFQYSAMAYVTALEDERLQPRNRFALNVYSKFLEFGVGDLYPYYNELMLWGRRVRGFSGALNLGFINFQFTSGQTLRRIAPAFAPGTTTITSFGTYRQNLKSGRISFGRGDNFQLGLTGLSVRDDRASLNSGESAVTPKDNIVAGADLLIRLHKRRIELKASAAVGLLTQDITNGPSSKSSIDSTFDTDIPIDPSDFKKYFIINESTTPLDPSGGTSVAYIATLRLNYLRNFLQFGLKRYGSEYNSLGQTYLRNNIKGYFVTDRINLFRNRIHMNLGIENYADNFNRDDGNPKTDLTTVNYGLSIYPGPNLPMVNFGVRNYVRDNGIDQLFIQQAGISVPDTTDSREESVSRDLTFNVAYNFFIGAMKHTLNLSIINSKLIDEFSNTRLTQSSSRDFSNLVQSIAVKSELRRNLKTVISFATNKNASTRHLNEVDFTMFSGRTELSMLQQALTWYAGFRSVSSTGLRKSETLANPLAKIDYNQISFQLGLYLLLKKRHRIILDVDLINFDDNGQTLNTATGTYVPNPSYKNSLVRLFYEFKI